ncbi:hypothetical protein ACH5RR_040355 [Cinchona calisaya]|uniref:Disease resistance protein RGA3 n=1 Tax=Cinchona calisaya TaxID=153742 RepID=A0ABD2XS83_9GENT
MAGAAIFGAVAEFVLEKLLSLSFEEIGLTLGVKDELKKLENKLVMIQALLSDAQSRHSTSKVVQRWMENVESIALDAEIVLDEFGYEVLRQNMETRTPKRKWAEFCESVSSSNPMAHKIKNIMDLLGEAFEEGKQIGLRAVDLPKTRPNPGEIRLTHPFVDDSEIVGRDDDISSVKGMLTSSDYKKDLPVIAVVGMGGQGKTTLAQLVYNDDAVVRHFNERIWFCVSNDFNVVRLLNEMLQSLTRNKVEMTNREALVKELQEKLKDKRYLLVLDDVWNENQDEWESMRNCLLGIGGSKSKESKIMVTTRSDVVAEVMRTSYCHHLHILSDDSSWMLLEKIAFAEGGPTRTQALVDIGKRIVRRCGGVPLAIKAIGGLLYSKKDAWEWSEIDRSTQIWSNPTYRGMDRVSDAIKLSYDHLPSLSLKQCFAACSIFPKDTLLEMDVLVQMWMAQGLINPLKESSLQMEDIGSNYVNLLLQMSLLQNPEKDFFNNITRCKMHDLVHDFSLRVSKNYCFDMEVDSHDQIAAGNDIKAMHLLLISDKQKRIKKENLKRISLKLRTLVLNGSAYLEDILASFRYISTLIVQNSEVEVLPTAIGDMKLLSFLDITDTKISTLPDSFTILYNLQTLRVDYLDELPKGFGKLINLRNFYMSREFSLSGIRQLTNLRTLSEIRVVREVGGFQLEELEHLDSLRGTLKISGLEDVSGPESAAKANLWRKSNIHMLELIWDPHMEDHNGIEILEGLKPHSNLRSLTIVDFQCSSIPSWMVTKNHPLLLYYLVKIKLETMPYCKQIPPLGDLPYLQVIKINGLESVECIGSEFYGCTNLDGASNSHETAVTTLFPALRKLDLRYMRELSKWSDAMIQSNSSSVYLFPLLEKLYLCNLPELELLPNLGDLKCLRTLTIEDCKNLTRLPISKELVSLEKLVISWCPNLSSLFSEDSDEALRGFGSIESIDLTDCANLVGVPKIHSLLSLCQLTIIRCDGVLASWTRLETLTSLEDLVIYGSPRFWPSDLQDLTRLTSLKIGGRYHQDDDEPLDYFPWHDSKSGSGTSGSNNNIQPCFVSLTSLELSGRRNLKSLPEPIQYISALRDLTIKKFEDLEALPEWLGKIPCLENLTISTCSNLKQLPNLTNLQQLSIWNCPLLKQRCAKDNDAEWHKIAHIPEINIDGVSLKQRRGGA